MTFTKARNLFGADAEGLEVTLTENNKGRAVWQWQTLDASTYQRVIDLGNEGLSQAEIARELDVCRSTVSRHFRKANDAGLIKKAGKK
jgi:DNA-binding NarL/FixJ family response regulator